MILKLNNPASDSGITLIEIMVTVVISSLVIAAAYTFFNASIKSWDYSSSRLDATQNTIFVFETLERLLKENPLNVKRWHFANSSKFPGLDYVRTTLNDEFRPGIPFADAIFLSFLGPDEVDSHSSYFGFF
ncbi:MAG: prepilin-type N-terminal cleavage/methylation domain-containing protein, partial [Candidatus Wallbacteria bacterium]|nr:prepilin-type N-terminal cleavage/methylation domain-containing protein [Candidatus Wallbacteria bacterium]